MKAKILIPLAGLAFFCACKEKTGYEFVNNSNSADSTKMDTTVGAGPKLVKTAGMRFKVKNVDQTSEHIAVLTTDYHGMMMHHQMGSTSERSLDIRISNDSVMRVTSFYTTADITVKVPSEKLDEFMNKVAGMGIYVNNRSMDITDKSLDYLSARLKLQSRNELVSQQKKGKVIIKNPANVLLLKDEMVDQQISNRQIDDAVKESVVSLSFYQSNTINREVIANNDPSVYNLSFFKRLWIAVENGWSLFADVVVGLINLWVFMGIGFGVWVIIKYYKRKKPVEFVKN
jgi:hypothetical protein